MFRVLGGFVISYEIVDFGELKSIAKRMLTHALRCSEQHWGGSRFWYPGWHHWLGFPSYTSPSSCRSSSAQVLGPRPIRRAVLHRGLLTRWPSGQLSLR